MNADHGEYDGIDDGGGEGVDHDGGGNGSGGGQDVILHCSTTSVSNRTR